VRKSDAWRQLEQFVASLASESAPSAVQLQTVAADEDWTQAGLVTGTFKKARTKITTHYTGLFM
jgi:hypothetical protein